MTSFSLRTILVAGDDWLTARFDGAGRDDAVALSAALQAAAEKLRRAPPGEGGGWLDVVPGIADLSVRFDPMGEMPEQARARLARVLQEIAVPPAEEKPLIDIPVCYGGEYGPDLAACASQLSLGEEAIVALHTGEPFLVQMMGFAPGFAYCGQTPDALAAQRLSEPRARVEAGSIGIVGRQTCLYSLAGPGGWPLIGRTPLSLFDPGAERPFLLSAGSQIRFRAISADEFDRLKGGA